ncbi:50S ribosomal protein L3 [Candidatus Woesearchaeota archaeon]|nr:50S ribosomal protein L3 [Candidatus Woesearchaeota archaeon]
MAKRVNPRHGSMGVWPRKRAKRPIPRIRSWSSHKAGLLGFAGYKAGMTHIIGTDARKNSPTKGEDVVVPVTVIECPPMKLAGIRAYILSDGVPQVRKEALFKPDKHLARKRPLPKSDKFASEKDIDSFASTEKLHFLTALVHTNPSLTGIKKTPELFELHIGGSSEEQTAFIKEHITKPISINDVFEEGNYIDAHAITRGKGFQGPVKRFGINLKKHKSEKGRRTPGSLGGWKGHGHFMYRIAHAGQMGFHQRVNFNSQVIKIIEEPFNPKGGFVRYGMTKNPCLLVRGSIPGPKKRLVVLTAAVRQKRKDPVPSINHISKSSQQG